MGHGPVSATPRRRPNSSNQGPTGLKLNLILDGTGVSRADRLNWNQATVQSRVQTLIDLTLEVKGGAHEPSYLKIVWGGFLFECRLASLTFTYTTFDRNGQPLRAELELSLLADQDLAKQESKQDKQSPDVTHARLVRGGDTLPLLTREVYGRSDLYLQVARVNELDHVRDLVPGKTLIFPSVKS